MHPTNVGLMLDLGADVIPAITKHRRVSARGCPGGERSGHPHSAPPLVGKENESFFLYFAVISVKIGHFKHKYLKLQIFFS